MKNQILIIVLFAVLVGGASYTYIARQELKNREFEIQARKEEAALKQAEAKRKTAEAESRKAKEQAAEAKSKADAAKDERQSRLAAEAEAKELAKAKADEARKAEAEAEIAAENARKAEAVRKTAEAKRAEAEAMAKYAAATNAIKQTELETALTAARIIELDIEKTIALSNTIALQKADYAAKLIEVEQLQDELRRREEETRPNKTLLQLIEAEEKAFQAELAEMAKKDAQFAEEEAVRRRVLREGVPAAPKKPLSPTDQRLENATRAINGVSDEVKAVFEKRLLKRLDAVVRQAIKDGRAQEAECYIKTIKSLVPEYELSNIR
jgi:colicin import membrane protein